MRFEALRRIFVLLERHRTEVLSFLDDIFPALLTSLSDPSDEVALLVLELQACIARDPQYFQHLMSFLVHHFNSDHSLLKRAVPYGGQAADSAALDWLRITAPYHMSVIQLSSAPPWQSLPAGTNYQGKPPGSSRIVCQLSLQLIDSRSSTSALLLHSPPP